MTEEEQKQANIQKSLRRTKIAIIAAFTICIALAATVYILSSPPPPHKYDAFARCINQSGATFYGAFWCPHCAQQKTMFGTGAQYLPYHECSTPDGQHETADCTNAGVKNYPTWVFKDGSRSVGVLPLSTLSQKTGCPLTE